MKTFRELCNNKPSKAVRAMIRGLRRQDRRNDFEIDMTIFLLVEGDICFGCAATCAIEEITGNHIMKYKKLKSRCFVKLTNDLVNFENAIDCLRVSDTKILMNYFGLENIEPTVPLNILNTIDWRENLEPYKIYAEQLEKLGL